MLVFIGFTGEGKLHQKREFEIIRKESEKKRNKPFFILKYMMTI